MRGFTVSLQWTTAAIECLKKLPTKVRAGLLRKADDLLQSDPREHNKPLTGPLQNCRRITYGRYRAIYRVDEETLQSGEVRLHLKVLFIAAGIRKERDKKDVYRVAQKLVELGLVFEDEDVESDEAESDIAE